MKHWTLYFLTGVILISCSGLAATSHANPDQYQGSSFNEVWDVITDTHFQPKELIAQKEFSIYQAGRLPNYPMNAKSLFGGDKNGLARDAERTVNDRFDYYDRLPKKLHPNGVCVAGEWHIDAKTNFTGYFASQSRGLFIGRISVAMEDTLSGKSRGFGFAGKVFPTVNSNETVPTANFFTVDVLLGTKAKRVLDVKTTNEPALGFNFSLVGLMLKVAAALESADKNAMFRPLSQVGTLGYAHSAINHPKWIRLAVADQNLKKNDEPDFRYEIVKAMAENREINYSIEVSNTTHDRNSETGWTKIGAIKLNKAAISYGCDRRLHFSHPKLK